MWNLTNIQDHINLLQQVVSSPLFKRDEEDTKNGVQDLKIQIFSELSQNGDVSNIQIRNSDLMVERDWEDFGAKFGKWGGKLKRKPSYSWKKTKKRWSRFFTGVHNSK